jgi:tetratricopeptide (TPR) repeat protein
LKAIEGNPQRADSHLVLGFAAAGLGLKDEAIREGIAATELTPVSRDAIDGPDYVAGLSLIYLYAGEHDKALDLLQTMVAMPAMHMATPGFLKLNAQWDKVREDPKFKRALAGGEAAIRSRPPRG